MLPPQTPEAGADRCHYRLQGSCELVQVTSPTFLEVCMAHHHCQGTRDWEPSAFLGEYTCHQFSSVAQSCLTLCDPMNCSTPGFPVHHQLPEFTQTYAHRVGDDIQPSHPLSSPFLLPPIPPSIKVFSNESTLRMRWPNNWSFSFSISPSKEHPGLISYIHD